MSRIRGHLSFANVVSLLALFVALGAGAYAAGLPNNSVTSRTIKNGEVKSADVEDHGLSAKDIKVGGLPDASSGRKGSGSNPCQLPSGDFNSCADIQLKLTRPAKVFATGNGNADSGAPGDVGVITCALFADGNQFSSESISRVEFADEQVSVSGVSQKLGRGTHAIELNCHGQGNAVSPRLFVPSLSALTVGTG